MRGGAAWGMLTGKGRYRVCRYIMQAVRSISERVRSVREDALYKIEVTFTFTIHISVLSCVKEQSVNDKAAPPSQTDDEDGGWMIPVDELSQDELDQLDDLQTA